MAKINSVDDARDAIDAWQEEYWLGDSNCPLKNCPQEVIDNYREATNFLYDMEEKFNYLMKFVKNIEEENGCYYISFYNNTPWLDCIKIDKEHFELFKKGDNNEK